jgi:hypothetical protein
MKLHRAEEAVLAERARGAEVVGDVARVRAAPDVGTEGGEDRDQQRRVNESKTPHGARLYP